MFKHSKIYSRLNVFLAISILLLGFFSLCIAKSFCDLNKSLTSYPAQQIDLIEQRMNSIFLEINSFPRLIGDDLMFLSQIYSFTETIEFADTQKEIQALNHLAEDFLAFMKGSTSYYELIYIDEDADEKVKIVYDGNNYDVIINKEHKVTSEKKLFDIISRLEQGEVFVSKLDLNKINGKLENRGTESNPEYVPIMSYSTPAFSETGEFEGVVLLNIYMDYFLQDVRRFQRTGDTVVLINEDGDYLAHPSFIKEFGSIVGSNENFYNDYPEIDKNVLSHSREERIETDDLIFSFKYIYPTSGNFAIHQGSKRIFGENPENEHYWTLVNILKKDQINKFLDKERNSHILSVSLSILIVILILALLYMLTFRCHK